MEHCHNPRPCSWVSLQYLSGFIPLVQDEAENYKPWDIVVLAVSASPDKDSRLPGLGKGVCVWPVVVVVQQVKIWRLLPMVLGKFILLGPVCLLHPGDRMGI